MGKTYGDVLWGTVALPLGLLLQLGALYILVHHFGAERYGTYEFIIATMLICQMVGELGLGPIVTQRVARADRPAADHIAVCLPVILVLAVAAGLLLMLVCVLSLPGRGAAMAAALAGANVVLYGMVALFSSVLRGLRRFNVVYALFVLHKVIALGVILAVVLWLDGGLIWGMAAWPVASLVSVLFYLRVLVPAVWRGQTQWRLSAARDYVRDALPVAGVAGLTRLTAQLDTYVVMGLLGPAPLSFYAAAQRPVLATRWFAQAVVMPTFPGLCRTASADRPAFLDAARRVCLVNWLAAQPFATFGYLLAAPLVALVLPAGFDATATVFIVLAWSVAPTFLNLQLRFLYLALERQGLYLKLSGAYFLGKVGLMYGLMQVFDDRLIGACCGAAGAEALFALTALVGLGAIDVRIRVLGPIVGLSLATAATVAIIRWMTGVWWLQAAACVVHAIVMLWAAQRILKGVPEASGETANASTDQQRPELSLMAGGNS